MKNPLLYSLWSRPRSPIDSKSFSSLPTLMNLLDEMANWIQFQSSVKSFDLGVKAKGDFDISFEDTATKVRFYF